jgi:primosomal protein N'
MIKLLKFLFGKPKPPKYKCIYCGREFDNNRMPQICHDLDLKINRFGPEKVKELKEKEFSKIS